MPRNGSGGFNLVTNSWNPAINGVSASASDYQALINDIAAAIQQSVSADGQTPIVGNLNMNGNLLTGLAAGAATGQSLRWEQLFSQGLQQDIAAATTTDIGSALSVLVNVTGSATISSFGVNYNGPRFLLFSGVCTLTNSATLSLPGGANIVTSVGDGVIAVPLGNPATGWRVIGYAPASGVYSPYQNGQMSGFRNLIINGNFQINQRNYVSGTNVAASNTYTLDRWRVVTSGQNLTYSTLGNGRQIVAPIGGVEQVIEDINVGGGTYVLNWSGTATATVNGTARAKGEPFILPANTNVTVRLINGSASQIQLEPGFVPTPFENRLDTSELALCQRYYFRATPGAIFNVFGQGAANAATQNSVIVHYPGTFRTKPNFFETTGVASDYSIIPIGSPAISCNAVPAYNSPASTNNLAVLNFFVASGLTVGFPTFGSTSGSVGASQAYLGFGAEL